MLQGAGIFVMKRMTFGSLTFPASPSQRDRRLSVTRNFYTSEFRLVVDCVAAHSPLFQCWNAVCNFFFFGGGLGVE